jgi:hypothetical protein
MKLRRHRKETQRSPEFWSSGPVLQDAILPRRLHFRRRALHFVDGRDLGRVRLMNLLTALDQDVEIVIRRRPRSRKTGRISVVAA